MIRWRREAIENLIKQIRVGVIEQRFEPVEVTAIETRERGLREPGENEVALLCPAMPAAEHARLPPEIEVIFLRAFGSGVEVTDRQASSVCMTRVDDVVGASSSMAVV